MPATIGDLIEKGGRVQWRCEVAPDHSGDADLARIAAAKGTGFSLANRRPPCPRPGCPGRVAFLDHTGSWPRALDTIGDRDTAWWDYTDQRRAELLALGWRIVMGKWVAPAPLTGG